MMLCDSYYMVIVLFRSEDVLKCAGESNAWLLLYTIHVKIQL